MPTWTRLIGGWVLALIVALALSWGAVSMVRGGVIESSGSVSPSAETTTEPSLAVVASSTQTAQDGVGAAPTTVEPTSSSSQSIPRTPTSSTLASTGLTVSSSSTSSSSTSSSSTSSTSSTTSTTTSQPLTTKTYQLIGGTVTISSKPGVVNFKAAVPQSGYSTEVKDSGPDRVRVEFENNDDQHSRFEAEWDSGKLVVSIEE